MFGGVEVTVRVATALITAPEKRDPDLFRKLDAVAGRVREIGALRALGFRRGVVLWAFMAEAILLGLLAGLVGLALASFMQLASFSTTNFQTFADLSFRFILTPGIAVKTLLFALVMGFAGGFLPAFRAARLNIVDALRAV